MDLFYINLISMDFQLVQFTLLTLFFCFVFFAFLPCYVLVLSLHVSALLLFCIGLNQIKSGLLKGIDLPVLKKILVIAVLCVSTAPQSLRKYTPIRLMMVSGTAVSPTAVVVLHLFNLFKILHLSRINLGMCPSFYEVCTVTHNIWEVSSRGRGQQWRKLCPCRFGAGDVLQMSEG